MNTRTSIKRSVSLLLVGSAVAAVAAVPCAAGAALASSAGGVIVAAAGTISSSAMPQTVDHQADRSVVLRGGVLCAVAALREDDPPETQPPPAASRPPDKKERGWRRDKRPFRPGEGPLPPRGERRPRGAGEGPPPGEPPKPSPEMIAEAMEILRDRLPDFHQRMMRLREQRPARFERMMHQVLPLVLEYRALRDRHPEIAEILIREFEIEDRLRRLSDEFRKAADRPDEQAAIGAEIERLVQEQLELRFRRQAARLDEFERRIREQQQRLEAQRAKLREESERRADLVAQRVAEVKEGKVGDSFRGRGPHSGGPPGGFKRRPGFGPGHEDGPGLADRPPFPNGPPPPPGDEPE